MDQAGAGPVGSCFALPVAFGWKGCFFWTCFAWCFALFAAQRTGHWLPLICFALPLVCQFFLVMVFGMAKIVFGGRNGKEGKAILISMVPGLRLSYTCVTHLYVLLIRDTKKGSAVERAFLFELIGGTKFST